MKIELNDFAVKLSCSRFNDNYRTYELKIDGKCVGDCEIRLERKEKYLVVFSINTHEREDWGKGYAKFLYFAMEIIAKELKKQYVIGEWSQQEVGYDNPESLAFSCGFKIMEERDYTESGYTKVHKINYIKKLKQNK